MEVGQEEDGITAVKSGLGVISLFPTWRSVTSPRVLQNRFRSTNQNLIISEFKATLSKNKSSFELMLIAGGLM